MRHIFVGKVGELLDLTIQKNKYVGIEEYDLVLDQKRTIGELKAVDNRVSHVESIHKYESCGVETETIARATRFEVHKSKIYFIYEDFGQPLEWMNTRTGTKS